MQSLKISFDFDATLSEKPMQDLCLKFMEKGIDVFVVTSRVMMLMDKPVNNSDLFEVTDRLRIPRDRVIFTGYEDKYKFVKEMDLHFDDSFEEIFLINQYPYKTIGMLYESKFKGHGIIDY